jgi:hypothetical protein
MDFGISFLYRIGKDIYGYFTRNKRSLTHTERVDLRQRWKEEFDEKLLDRRRRGLRSDVIVRDVARADQYPELDEKKGISSWFRAGLLDTYHRGVLLGLEWKRLKKEDDGSWRFPSADEAETLTAILAGYVRFENIQQVNWDGDEFYGFSHIYCHFDEKGKTPYEALKYCEEKELDGRPFYVELEILETVKKNSR